jgi:hypothetical protein
MVRVTTCGSAKLAQAEDGKSDAFAKWKNVDLAVEELQESMTSKSWFLQKMANVACSMRILRGGGGLCRG